MTPKKAKRVAIIIIALAFFPISVPLLIVNKIKRGRRKTYARAFASLSEDGLEPALQILNKHRKHVPVGADHLFKAFAASTDQDWQVETNKWLSTSTPIRVSLKFGEGSRFERIQFSEVSAVHRPEKVTVIMPAYNAGRLVRAAVNSILRQSWKNLELIVVDDCSSDDTGTILDNLAQSDPRMRVLHNAVNVGPYVSKNIGLSLATGDFVTGHDADDLALPDRLERQVDTLTTEAHTDAVIGHMVRLNENAVLSYASEIHNNSFDGLHRLAMISLMARRSLFSEIGFWDSVRFAADSEMFGRLKANGCKRVEISRQLTMLCLDSAESLTNHAEFGIGKARAISTTRQDYKASWSSWHETKVGSGLHRSFSNTERPFDAPEPMLVPQKHIEAVQAQHLGTRSIDLSESSACNASRDAVSE